MVFTGTYHRSLDDKFRVLLPKRLRQPLSEDTELYLTPGTDHCLELHTGESLNALAIRAQESNAGTQNFKTFARLFYARARHCEIDKQGRIRVPAELAELASLTKDMVFVGVGFHWEVWDVAVWKSFVDSNDASFDEFASAAFSGPVAGKGSEPGAAQLEKRVPR